MKKGEHKGQVALILVLIMTVVSALAVSLASRSTVDTRIQQSESEGVQALISAQTGLEQLIMNPDTGANSVSGDTYTATRSETGSAFLETGLMETGSSVELNLEGANAGLTAISVSWGPDKASPSDKPAIFISVIENNGTISDYAYDYDKLNGFTMARDGSGGYAKKTTDDVSIANASKVRITVLGSPALLKIEPIGSIFPSQIKTIKSVGSVPSDNKTVKYGLQYDESAFDTVPSVFDYALFSGGSISQ